MIDRDLSHDADVENLALGQKSSSAKQLVDRAVHVFLRIRHILEAAAERIVVTHRRPIDAEGRIDGGLHVLGFDIALAGPAVFGGGASRGVCRSDRPAASDSGAREHRELLQEVVAALRGR